MDRRKLDLMPSFELDAIALSEELGNHAAKKLFAHRCLDRGPRGDCYRLKNPSLAHHQAGLPVRVGKVENRFGACEPQAPWSQVELLGQPCALCTRKAR